MHAMLTYCIQSLSVRESMPLCSGSERVGKSEATGDRLEEAKHINKSLSALGDAIFCLNGCCVNNCALHSLDSCP